jgi:SAM-dependent methyltransferase
MSAAPGAVLAAPAPDAIAEAARRSPLREGRLTEHADLDELRYREEIETLADPTRQILEWMGKRELLPKLEDALARSQIEPRGTIVELGAGSAWLSAALARSPSVERAIAIDFSRDRLVNRAPVAMAILDAPPEKVERVIADFYDPGLPDGSADLVVMDAAFHHASEPQLLADKIAALLKPGGHAMLFREPTLSLLRRKRERTVEDEHGEFEHGYDWWDYLRFLRRAGLEARKVRSTHSFTAARDRLRLRPPLSWLNGTLWSVFTYVGRKP